MSGDPDSWEYYSRGIVRAENGDRAGAIADFQQFVTWAQNNALFSQSNIIQERQDWITALQEGKNPFATNTMATVLDEFVGYI